MPTKDRRQLLQAFQQRNFEQPTKIESQEVSLPKPDKVVEWALLEIVDLLTAINVHLAKSSARP